MKKIKPRRNEFYREATFDMNSKLMDPYFKIAKDNRDAILQGCVPWFFKRLKKA